MSDTSNSQQPPQRPSVNDVNTRSNLLSGFKRNQQRQDQIAQAETRQQPAISSTDNLQSGVDAIDTIPSLAIPSTPYRMPPDISHADTMRIPSARLPLLNSPGPSGPAATPEKPPRRTRKSLKTRYSQLSRTGKILVIALLICILLPLFGTIFEGINSYTLYKQVTHGVQQLQDIQKTFSGLHGNTAEYLDKNRLLRTQADLNSAQLDFQQLRDKLDQDGFISTLGWMLPQQISTARALSHIGVDVTEMGQQMLKTALILPPSFKDSLFTPSKIPLITPSLMATLHDDITVILPLLNDIQSRTPGLYLNSIPVLKASQIQQISSALQLLPLVNTVLPQIRDNMSVISWLIGVDAPRTFLVQTMDRAELRPTGGFTGQFSPVALTGGRMENPFVLQDIGPFEKGDTMLPAVRDQVPPAPYNSWWPVGNWGLRDSNLSADFPTSAKLASARYQAEFNTSVDGEISFSLFLVADVLQITGPITVPLYHETITSQNLEDRLHFYQEVYGPNGGIIIEKQLEHVNDDQIARKLFTKRLTQALMDHLRKAPLSELLALANEMLYAVKTKDIEVYFNNPQAEALVARYATTAQIDTSTSHDGLMLVQTNVSADKASKYVKTNIQDTVTLNAAGGATHVMKLFFAYTQIDNVFGFDTYRDYLRIYVPASAQFRTGNGFDQGTDHPLCGFNLAHCTDDVYKNGMLLCPAGLTDAGYGEQYLNDNQYFHDHSIDKIGPPTNTTSDLPGRTMYGGWVTIPKNCNMTVTLSWYVPPASGQHMYSLLVQRQAGTQPVLDLTLLPTPSACEKLHTAGLYFNGVLAGPDVTFTAPQAHPSSGGSCYPHSGV